MYLKNFQTLRYNVSLKPYTFFKTGGQAERLFFATSEEHLIHILQQFPQNMPKYVFGNFSNSLIRDGGLDGLTIILNHPFNTVQSYGLEIHAQSGALSPFIARYAAHLGIGGFEFLSGIPGTIGGAIAMNAGIPMHEMKDIVLYVHAVDELGHRTILTPKDLNFSYRYANLHHMIVTKVVMRGFPQNPALCHARIKSLLQKRAKTQPIGNRTAGSTFKNPDGGKAAQLIESSGGKGLRINDAMMSTKHANFMLNTSHATSYHLETLGKTIQQLVYARYHIHLKWEIKRVGMK